MNKIETYLNRFVFGAVFPILLFLAGWWTSFLFRVPENRIFFFALAGLASGLLINVFLLKKWMKHIYDIDSKILMMIYMFYSICFFGFFMGVPVFNIIPGIFAGFYLGRKSSHFNLAEETVNKVIRSGSLFTTLVMGLICIGSAYFALKDPSTAANLQAMFKVHFEITHEMLFGLIVFGGVFLVTIQYLLTKWAAQFAFNLK